MDFFFSLSFVLCVLRTKHFCGQLYPGFEHGLFSQWGFKYFKLLAEIFWTLQRPSKDFPSGVRETELDYFE